MNRPDQIVVLLGSNIQPERNLPQAVALLSERFRIRGVSSVWESAAVGSDGPDFLNAAVLLKSGLSPQVLKDFIFRPLEAYLGRVRTRDKNAPRPIDLDVVIWGNRTWEADLWRYAHVAVPVAELIPDFRSAGEELSVQQVAQKLRAESGIRARSDVTRQLRVILDSRSSDRGKPARHSVSPELANAQPGS